MDRHEIMESQIFWASGKFSGWIRERKVGGVVLVLNRTFEPPFRIFGYLSGSQASTILTNK